MEHITLEELPEFISVPELAECLGISRSGAYNLCKSGQLPNIKIGNTVRIRKAALLDWIAENERQVAK